MNRLAGLLFLFCYCQWFIPTTWAQTYVAGNSYIDSTGYIEYLAGDLPIILSAPHGGYVEPASIPDRNCSGCTYIRDAYTQELGRAVYQAIYQRTGCYPHLIINLLHRKKLDANRSIITAADSNATAEAAWYAYHNFIDSAKAKTLNQTGRGLFFDLHGHGHTIQRLELGYLLSGTRLRQSDSLLNQESASIDALVANNTNSLDLSTLVRGGQSFGSICELKGYPSVPSTNDPFPLMGEPFFSGGYNTQRHGSRSGGQIDAIQIECNSAVRFNSADRAVFADSLATAMIEYWQLHYTGGTALSACQATGLSTKATIKSRVYPNPSKEQYRILMAAEHYPLHLEVYNTMGQLLTTQVLPSNQAVIQANDLKSGIYSLHITDTKGVKHTQLLQVQH